MVSQLVIELRALALLESVVYLEMGASARSAPSGLSAGRASTSKTRSIAASERCSSRLWKPAGAIGRIAGDGDGADVEAQGGGSDGERRMIPYLARAATACGCDGIFLETHPRPDEALSDGPNMIPLQELPRLVRCCLRLRDALHDIE